MIVNNKQLSDGGLEINLKFSPFDIKCLKHTLNGIDGIVAWYSSGPSAEKIDNSFSQMVEENKQLALSISSSQEVLKFISFLKSGDREGVVNFISSMPLYQNREAREIESLKLRALEDGLISK